MSRFFYHNIQSDIVFFKLFSYICHARSRKSDIVRL